MSNTRKARAAEPEQNGLPAALATALAGGTRPQRTVPLCLRADLVAELDSLEAELKQVRPSQRMVGNAENRAIAERIEELRVEMQASVVPFILRALPRVDMREFNLTHRPRDGHADDHAAGINIETYFPDLVRASILSPELTDRQYWQLVGGDYTDPETNQVEAFDGVLSAGQFEQLAKTASDLNMAAVNVPFSSSASVILRSSDESSKRPRDGESATSDSTAGNPPR